MQKLLWVIFVIPLVAHAQFKKGDTYVGGSLSNFTGGGGVTATPFVGYFINPRLALGADLQVSYAKGENESQFSDTTHHVLTVNSAVKAGLTARRLYAIADKFFFALDGEVYYQRFVTKQEVPDLNSTRHYKSYSLGLTVAPVFMYFPSSRWSVEAGVGNLGYNFSRGLSTNTKSQSVGIYLGTVTLGFAYYFRK